MISRSRMLETIVVCGVLVMGTSAGSFASRHAAVAPMFHQAWFGPAVMVASGRGFVNPVVRAGSPLDEFLSLRRASLDRADLLQISTTELDQYQQGMRYLMLLIGNLWKFTGISWPAVSSIQALMYGLTTVACYAIGRLWLPRALSVLAAAFVAVSPTHVNQVPYLRDYVKAPFILFAIPLIVVVALRPLSRRRLAWLSAACGAVVGIGVCFRMDVLIMAPIFLFSVLCFRDRRPWTGLMDKGVAAGVFLGAFTLASAPVVFRVTSGGSNAFHVILLGYADLYDANLGTVRSVYHLLPFYSDGYGREVVSEHAARGARFEGFLPLPSAQYDAATRAYWTEIIRHFPADILTRALGAANAVLNLPFKNPPYLLTAPSSLVRVGAVFDALRQFDGWGIVFGVVLICAASAGGIREGLFAVWMVLVLTGYTSLQFSIRHAFHLEIIPVVAALLPLRFVMRARRPTARQVARVAAAPVVVAVALGVPLGTLRAYQSAHLKRMFQQYVDAPKHAVEPVFSATEIGTWRVTWDEASNTRAPAADYYDIEFDGAAGPPALWLDFRYRYEGITPDYSSIVPMSSGGVDHIFVPAYVDPPVRNFDGLELSGGAKRRLRGIYRIDHPECLPLLLTLKLPDDWRRQGLYQTLRVEGARDTGAVPVIGDFESTPASRVKWLDRVDSPATLPSANAVDTTYADAVHVTPNGIALDAVARYRSSYLMSFKPVDVRARGALLVRGHLDAGGLSLGVLKGGRLYRQVILRAPGDFVGVIDIPDAGAYVPLITNATPGDGERTKFVLSRFGVVSAE